MAVLNIRNLPEEVHRKLRVRAARTGRSMEAEARDILTRACTEAEERVLASSLQEWVKDLYGKRKPRNVTESLIAERRREADGE